MGLRGAKCYHWDSPAYTRYAKDPSSSYITGIPGSKIQRFNMGNLKGNFNTEISVITEVQIQLRHNALESVRTSLVRWFEKRYGAMNFRIKIRVYPHHVMRENAMATGAGADRVQDGMRRSFGKPVGRAARVTKGKKVLSVYIDTDGENDPEVNKIRSHVKKAALKFPGIMKVAVEHKPGESEEI